jgi:hypothetical protein
MKSSHSDGATSVPNPEANGTVVNLAGGYETLLWTLLARATDAVSLSPILDDYYALETIARVKRTGFKFRSSALGSIWQFLARVVSVRSKSIDMVSRYPLPSSMPVSRSLVCTRPKGVNPFYYPGQFLILICVDSR